MSDPIYTPKTELTLEMFEEIVRKVNEGFREIDYSDRLYRMQSPAIQKQIFEFIKKTLEEGKPITYGNFQGAPNIKSP